ncbi:transposase [uncultured Candidatus Kuenenia sp.]|jgi:REP element-mobilizing transposase RayT|uniref:transposase n=1 Tax=uncultured Candidatus Kuenenia sp. TaxID=1048336 RepID=UPI0025F4E203|nr:transposase [uncultured Candidatus Kuenenia sp.]
MPGIARVVAPNYPHHIAQRGTNKTYIFLDDEDRRYFLQSVKDYADRTGTKIWAYCLMGNYFHLLLVPGEEQFLGKCLHGATFRYAQHFNTGAFPVFCNRLCDWGKTTLPGVNTTVRFIKTWQKSQKTGNAPNTK